MIDENKRIKTEQMQYTMGPLNQLRCQLTSTVLANIYSHLHEETGEKVRRAHAIADEILQCEYEFVRKNNADFVPRKEAYAQEKTPDETI